MATAAAEPMPRLDPATASWPDAPGWLPLTEDTVARIVEIEDPALRNLWITQSYAELGRRMLAVFEGDQSWCTFAVWASATAGVSIREDELPRRLAAIVDGSDEHIGRVVEHANRRPAFAAWMGPGELLRRSSVEGLIHEALGEVARSVAHGNTLVYAELAPIFVRLVEWLERDDFTWSCDHQAVLASIGVPSRDRAPLVHLAFDNYIAAAVASNAQTRAQHVLAANVAAVLHEQRRLQHDLSTALDAGLIDVGAVLELEGGRVFTERLNQRLVDTVRRRVAPHVESLWEHVATQTMMTLNLPGEELHLGRDVPPPADGRSLFPLALRTYELSELADLMTTWDLTGGTARGSGARDWSDLQQRMNYIVNLFRSRQQQLALTSPPFTQHQLDEMVAGRVPTL